MYFTYEFVLMHNEKGSAFPYTEIEWWISRIEYFSSKTMRVIIHGLLRRADGALQITHVTRLLECC
jgi:hypothetical protein